MDFYLVINTNIFNKDMISSIQFINLQDKKRYIKFPYSKNNSYVNDFYNDVYIYYQNNLLININEDQFFNILNSNIDNVMVNIIDFLKYFDLIEWYI